MVRPQELRGEIAFGVYSVTGMYGEVPRREAESLIVKAYEMGVRVFDTADIYGRGLGEELLKPLSGEPVLVATKVGYRLDTPRPVGEYSEDYLVKAARASLKRLGAGRVWLLQVHNPPLEVLKGRGVYRALRRIREEGLAEHTGVALGPEVDVLEHAEEALSHDEVEALQFVYNILEQEPGATIARMARERGVATIVRVPHAGGVLDESLKPGMEAGLRDHRSLRRAGWYRWAFKVYYGRVKPLLDPHPGTPGQKALRFIEESIKPNVIVVIARSAEKLKEYMAYKDLPPLGEKAVEELRRVYLEEVPQSPEAPRASLHALGII